MPNKRTGMVFPDVGIPVSDATVEGAGEGSPITTSAVPPVVLMLLFLGIGYWIFREVWLS